jgi:hypothetical protein
MKKEKKVEKNRILKDLKEEFKYAKERIEGNFTPTGIPEYSDTILYFLVSNEDDAERIFKQLKRSDFNKIGILIEENREKMIYRGFNRGEQGMLFRIEWENNLNKNFFTKEIESIETYNPKTN